MRFYIFILVGIFLVGIINVVPLASSPHGGGSDTETSFVIAGCTIPGQQNIPEGTCSSDGNWFCLSAGQDAQDTLTVSDACFYGNVSSNPPGYTCCPTKSKDPPAPFNYRCSRDAGSRVCERFDNICDEFNYPFDEEACLDADCFAVDEVCVSDLSGFGCSIYNDLLDCDKDIWRLGQRGVGTEVCGRYFSVMNGSDTTNYVITAESCKCRWDTDECLFDYAVSSSLYCLGCPPDGFKCSKSFNTGECIDNIQKINWTASASGFIGGLGSDDHDVLAAADCLDGERNRNCGEETIKLPFFSTFSLFLSIFLLGLFYFSREKMGGYWKGL